MTTLINLFLFFAFVGGVVGIIALWTQHDIDRRRERELSSQDGNDDAAR